MKKFNLFLLSVFCISGLFSQTNLQGSVTDEKTGEPIIFGTVAVYQNGVLLTGTETDFSGYYSLTELPAGIYDLVFSYTGYGDYKVVEVMVSNEKVTQLNAKLSAGMIPGCGFVCGSAPPLIRLDDTTQGFKFNATEIRRMAY